MAQKPQPKWEGEACAKLTGPTADQVWSLFEDFFNLHKWLPSIDTCRQVEGVPGQPGCIRYCAGTAIISSDGSGSETINWAKEKLLAIDPIKRCLSYEIIENNIGFNSYVATIKVFPLLPGENNSEDGSCKIEWSFTVDPVEGWRYEDLVSYFNSSLEAMAKRMQETLQATQ